jgi:hypothetical protein
MLSQACSQEEPVVATNLVTGEIGEFGSPDDVPDGWVVCENDICPDPVPDACEADACGPAPGAPNEICDDGTVGGPLCLEANGTCEWTIVSCNDEPQQCNECPGPQPGAPNYLCDDGTTMAGPACVTGEDGECGWTIIDCPAQSEG